MEEEAAPLYQGETEVAPQESFRKRARPWKQRAGVVGLCVGAACALGVAAVARSPPRATALNLEAVELSVSNAYERRLGVAIGDGWYPLERLVEAHKATRLELANVGADEVVEWSATHELEDAPMFEETGGQVVEATFTRVGAHRVDARRVALGRSASFNVTCRYVRRELRDLTAFDRNAYFDAMHVLYSTEQDLGVKLYGANFKSAAWLVREHLYGAADRECVCALFAPTVCAHDFVWILRAEPSRDHLAPLAAIRDVSVTV